MPKPSESQGEKSLFGSLHDSLNKRLGKNLYDQVVNAKDLKPTWTLDKVLAYAVAAFVHSFVLFFAALGLYLLLSSWSNFFAIAGAIICFVLAWFFFPRPPKLEGEILLRAQCPTLYQIADRIAQALDSPQLDGIVIDWRFNAMFSQIGWRRKRIMTLGLPLFWALEGQERLAIIGHEIAHGVNGDPARGFFLWTAINTLGQWYDILTSKETLMYETWSITEYLSKIAELIAGWLMRIIAILPWASSCLLTYLAFRESQRAEYLADYLGATVSGTEAAVSAHAETQRGGDMFWGQVQRLALSQSQKNLFDDLREHALVGLTRPRSEISLDDPDARIDATHPPTSFRIGFLRAHPIAGAKVVVSSAQWDMVERELVPLQKNIQQKLYDKFQRSLYY